MPRPRFQKLPADKRQRILEAAALEFASRGFEHASLNRIITAAGISKGAAYYYFDDKADLFATVVQHGWQMFVPGADVDLSLLDADAFWPVLFGLYAETLQKAHEQPWLTAFGKLVYGPPPSEALGGLVAEQFARAHRWLGELDRARAGRRRHPHRRSRPAAARDGGGGGRGGRSLDRRSRRLAPAGRARRDGAHGLRHAQAARRAGGHGGARDDRFGLRGARRDEGVRHGRGPGARAPGVDLDIFAGEILVLLGPSGSGKSTLLNIVGGLDRPTDGHIRYRDRDLTTASERDLTLFRRRAVGFVFQFYNLIPSLTARENVELVTEIADHPMPAAEALATGRPRRAVDHFPRAALGGRAAAGGDRARDREAARRPALRRADRRARHHDRRRRADGVVLQRFHESESVVPTGEPLVEIANPADLEIVADYLSTEAVQIHAGMPAIVDRWGGSHLLRARVRRVEPFGFLKVSALGVEEQRVNVVLGIEDPPATWRSLGDGYRVEVRVVLWDAVERAQGADERALPARHRLGRLRRRPRPRPIEDGHDRRAHRHGAPRSSAA